MTNQVFESKLWQAITAVASGIITSLLYDLVSHSSYIIQPKGSHYMLISDNNDTARTFLTICSIFILFFSIWVIITLLIQISSNISKHLVFKKMKNISGYKLANEYAKAKEQTFNLNNNFFYKAKSISDITYIKLHLRDLSIIITSLHVHFYPHNLYQRSHIKHYFRKPEHTTIINIGNTISQYEFQALIELLKKMVEQASSYASEDILIAHDCKEMSWMLNDLTTITNFTK